jgi:hypothetical protein
MEQGGHAMKRLVLALVVIALLLGCRRKAESYPEAPAPMKAMSAMALPTAAPSGVLAFDAGGEAPASRPQEAEPGAPPPPPSGQPSAQAIKPKIIRTGNAVLRTQDIDADVKKIEDKVKTLDGYVAASTQDASNELNKTANLTVKIPAEFFDGFMAFLQAGFKKEQIGTNSDDVTEEYVDVESRLSNFRLEEKRLLELLANRTGKLSDILEVERELARVREEIERMTGRIRFLDNRVGLSTIAITLIQSKEIESVQPSWTGQFIAGAKQTFLDGLMLLGGALRGLFLLAIGGLPFYVIGGIVIWVVVRIRRRRRLEAAAQSRLPVPPAPPGPTKAGE